MRILLPLTAPWWGLPPPAPAATAIAAQGGTSDWLAVLCTMALDSFRVPVVYLLAPLMIAASLLARAIGLGVLTRFGVFAYLVTVFFSQWDRLALSMDPQSLYFGQSVITMALFVAIAAYGFVLSTGGQLTFKAPVLD